MLKIKFFLVIIIVFVSFGFFVSASHAVDLYQQVGDQVLAGKATSGFGNSQDPKIIAATFVQFFLGLLATIFLIMIAMSAFWYITARGQTDKIEKATSTIRGAVIGLLIVMMAYSITYFVSKRIQRAVGIIPTSSIIELIVPTV